MKDIVVINTGGTFNKLYNQKTGCMHINKNEKMLKSFLKKIFRKDVHIVNIIQKDSLFIDEVDRELLVKTVQKQTQNKIVVIHGTDTMTTSSEFIAKYLINKTIVFTGAFVPYSIEPTEAVANLSLAVGYIQASDNFGVYVAMHGTVSLHKDIKKDKTNDTFMLI